MQPRVLERVPIGLFRHGLAAKQAQDHVEPLQHAIALGRGIDAQHHRVRGEQARPHAAHDAAHGHVIELHDPVRHHQRVVVGQRDHAGAEPDALGALGGGGDEELRRADDLEASGVMLADPRFLIAEPVQPLDQFEIAPQRQRRVLVDRMERGQKNAAAQGQSGHM